MAGWTKALLFGKPQRPYEPHGVAAPALRAVAWGLAALCGLTMTSGALVFWVARNLRVATFLVVVGVGGLQLAALVRVAASAARAMAWSPSGDDL